MELKLSSKQKRFLGEFNNRVDILEGSIRSGKTHVGVMKFMLKVLDNDGVGLNVAFAKNSNVFGRNVWPIMESLFPDAKYNKYGKSGPTVTWRGRTIYIIGFDTATRFKDVLGSSIAIGFIDEFNIMPKYMLEEILGRQASVEFPYLCMTANPDDPDLAIYEIINRAVTFKSNPNKEFFTSELKDWRAWFFTFSDNPIMTEKMIENTKQSQIPGTVYYETKILGLRKKAEGLIFGDIPAHVFVDEEELKKIKFSRLVLGVDTAYSKLSDDTIAIVLLGIYNQKVAYLEEFVHNNKDSVVTASELPAIINDKIQEWSVKYNSEKPAREIFIDNADANLINECEKWRQSNHSDLQFVGAYKAFKIVDRINAMGSWMSTGHYIVNSSCGVHAKELRNYAWSDKAGLVPVDKRDHTINASQYGWIPYRSTIGVNRGV